ncbi:receptor-like protein 37 [Salvia splendens]|uniref:receptor-like protein 37 n=1 Tax=Salvia splendens TaxID=180675 RepID=UPI001C2768C9|nr:receptor-like protein 37 [Salvia splendens]
MYNEILLLQLKDELIFNSSLSTKLVRWNESDHDCCKWYGVECDASGYVVSLQLDDEAISGGIGDLNICGSLTLPTINSTILSFQKVPSEVSTLTRLASLDISNEPNTTLSLELPNLKMLVQNLTGLRELYLDDVNGSIPSTFASLTKLIRVDLSYNSLAGSLPSASFEGLSNLVHLNLLGNSFSGNIPQSLFALPSLLELILSYNQFNGTFQLEDFQSLPNLTWLDLRYLDLSYNALEGKITKSLELCTWLGYMNIGNNKMNDTFPCMLSSNLGVLVCAPINSMGK